MKIYGACKLSFGSVILFITKSEEFYDGFQATGFPKYIGFAYIITCL